MSNKKQIQILKEVNTKLKSLPQHDMAVAGAIHFVDMAIRHLKENNVLLKQFTKSKHEKRSVPV